MPARRVLVPVAMVLWISAAALAHVPDSGPEVDAWFESLIAPDTGIPCCNALDCGPVPSRQGPAGWEAWYDGRWWPVPQDKVITGTVNPLQHGVLCWSRSLGLTCFVPPPAGYRRNRGS